MGRGNLLNCGCSVEGVQRYGHSCCKVSVADAPAPCCESHEYKVLNDPCFRLTCNAVASDTEFRISINSAMKNPIPLNYSEVWFYHQAVGRINILSRDQSGTYLVQLEDSSKAGHELTTEDCLWLQTTLASATGNSLYRCLSGQFLAPAVNGTRIMYIRNGSGIPVGSTITFSYEGEPYSYTVVSYESAANGRYAYVVQNAGAGVPANTLVDAGDNDACNYPLEIITEVDLCDLPTTTSVDSVTGCNNGVPSALKPTGPNQAIVSSSTSPYPLQLRTMNNLDCCVTTLGTLKFSEVEGCAVVDVVTLRDTNLDCFGAAVDEAFAANNNLPVVINGYSFVVTAYNSGTKQLTLSPVGSDMFSDAGIAEYASGTQICLGDCCNSCTGGAKSTNSNYVASGSDHTRDANFAITNPGNIPYNAGGGAQRSFLVGFNTSGVAAIIEIDGSYHSASPVKPDHADPLVLRQKICNTDLKGCDSKVRLKYNYQIEFVNVPALLDVFFEWGSYVAESDTLADGSTPNPNSYVSTQSKSVGTIIGPTSADTTLTAGTNIGFGNTVTGKHYPFGAGSFEDDSRLKKCDCLNSIVWLHVRTMPRTGLGAGGNILMNAAIRRVIEIEPYNEVAYPENNYDSEGWN